MKKQFLNLILGLSLVAFGAKAQDQSNVDEADRPETTESYDASEVFQEQLAKVYDASLALKEAFVTSDATEVRQAVSPVQEDLFEVEMKLLGNEARSAWADQLATMKNSLESMDQASTIDAQREHFADFSQALYRSIKSFGIGGQQAYYLYCPMANDDQGASWLSDSKQIRNPYFGDEMLTCGSVKEVIN